MVNSYKIKRWDVIILKNDNMNKTPIIYIKPDINLLNILNDNNWELKCNITNTNNEYEMLKNITIYFKNNCDIPNIRKNYFLKTGFIIGIINSEWNGYPPNLGEIIINNENFKIRKK